MKTYLTRRQSNDTRRGRPVAARGVVSQDVAVSEQCQTPRVVATTVQHRQGVATRQSAVTEQRGGGWQRERRPFLKGNKDKDKQTRMAI